MSRKEIITCQLGPFSSYAGAHFWNTQDDARHPVSYDASGDPVYDDQQMDAMVLYRAAHKQLTPRLIVCDAADHFGNLSSAGGVAVPAAPVTAATAMDPLSWGGAVTEVVQEANAAHAFAQMMRAPVLQDPRVRNSGPFDVGDYDEDDEGEEEDDEDYDEEDDLYRGGGMRRRRSPTKSPGGGKSRSSKSDPRMPGRTLSWDAAPAAADLPMEAAPSADAPGEDEEEEVTAAQFDFERSVSYWSDYLQAHLHPRSVAPLKPHAHNYSTLARFPDGMCIVQKEEDCEGGPGLVERVRRFLEECDAVQGFHLLLDADSGFGGAAAALLTQIRDDYSRAPCLALGLGTLSRPNKAEAAGSSGGGGSSSSAPVEPVSGVATVGGDNNGLGAHSYAPALNDAMSLTAFAELNTCYVPLYGSAGLRALLNANTFAAEEEALANATSAMSVASGAPAAAPAVASTAAAVSAAAGVGRRLTPDALASLYTGSPLATAPPFIAPRTDLRYHTSAPLAAMLDAITLPYRAHSPAGSLHGLVRTLSPRGGMHLATSLLGLPMPSSTEMIQRQGWLTPLLPLQRPPAFCRAYEQHVSWLGHQGGGREIAPLIPSLLPCRGEGGTLWVRHQPFTLPLSFPQFFSRSVGIHGEIVGAPNVTVGQSLAPELPLAHHRMLRGAEAEVLDVPVAAALQCSPSLLPTVRRVAADWSAERKAAERAGQNEGWAQRDELAEMSEQLAALKEAYSEEEGIGAISSTSGWSSG